MRSATKETQDRCALLLPRAVVTSNLCSHLLYQCTAKSIVVRSCLLLDTVTHCGLAYGGPSYPVHPVSCAAQETFCPSNPVSVRGQRLNIEPGTSVARVMLNVPLPVQHCTYIRWPVVSPCSSEGLTRIGLQLPTL